MNVEIQIIVQMEKLFFVNRVENKLSALKSFNQHNILIWVLILRQLKQQLKKKKATSKQTFLTQNTSNLESNVFFLDLCQALIDANIPWNKLSHPNFHGFLEKYCNRNIPHESTLRKTYLD